MRRTVIAGLAALLVLAAVGLWWPRQALRDDYNYAAAFDAAGAGTGAAAVVKIADIVGKTPDELAAVLGAPEDCETTLYSSRCTYAPGITEVVFIDGRADWITVNNPGETPFAPAALNRIGLSTAEPAQSGAEALLWTNLAGLREVRVVGAGGRVEYIRVRAKT